MYLHASTFVMGWAQTGSWVHGGRGCHVLLTSWWVEQGPCVPTPNTGQSVGRVDRTQGQQQQPVRTGWEPVPLAPGFGFARGHV